MIQEVFRSGHVSSSNTILVCQYSRDVWKRRSLVKMKNIIIGPLALLVLCLTPVPSYAECTVGDTKCHADGTSILECERRRDGSTMWVPRHSSYKRICDNTGATYHQGSPGCTVGDTKCSADGKSILECEQGRDGSTNWFPRHSSYERICD